MDGDPHGYLEQQSAEGQLHSTGQFTLDPTEALRKLRRYQIGRRYSSVLFLVQAAVMRQAEWVAYGIEQVDSSTVMVSCPPLTCEEFAQLATPFQENCSAEMFKLVLAIESACRLGYLLVKEIQIESGGKLLRIQTNGNRLPIEDTVYTPDADAVPFMPSHFEGIIFRVCHRLLSGIYLALTTGWHEGRALKYCGLPVYRGEQLKTKFLRRPRKIFEVPTQKLGRQEWHQVDLDPYPVENHYREVFLVATAWTPRLIPAPRLRESERQQWWVFDHPDQPHLEVSSEELQSMAVVPWLDFNGAPALACYAYFARFGVRSNCEIHWIQHGVLICTTEHSPQEFELGWRGVVHCDDLPSDLSGSKLVEGEAYRVRLEWLKTYLAR